MVRRAKRLGDLCLLAASPEDAIAHYNSAIETGRAQSDWLFVGSACEGLASCILVSTAAAKANTETSGLDVYDKCVAFLCLRRYLPCSFPAFSACAIPCVPCLGQMESQSVVAAIYCLVQMEHSHGVHNLTAEAIYCCDGFGQQINRFLGILT